MKPLILGDGLLGSELVKQTGWDYISRKKTGLDFTDPETYAVYLFEGKYDTVINCVAHTDTRDNTRDKHWEINYRAVKKLVDACNAWKLKLVHISTDYLYANSPEFATENDAPAPVSNWYSYTKLLSDGLVQLESKNCLIIRASFKPRPYPYPKAWWNLKGNFGYVDDITRNIVKLVERNAQGVYNVGGKLTTLYDLALETNPDVRPTDESYGNRPKNITMDLNKLYDFLESPI